MTNKEAIEEIKKLCPDTCASYRNEICNKLKSCEIRECIDIAINALEEQEKRIWIPVSEKLPEDESEYYLCCNLDRKIYIYRFSKDLYRIDVYEFLKFKDKAQAGFYDYDSEWGYRHCDEVVAWMPLPEAFDAEMASYRNCLNKMDEILNK